MAEIIVGAVLLRRLIGPRAALDRVEQVGGMLASARRSRRRSARPWGRCRCWPAASSKRPRRSTFWRTWWLGDTSGGLVVLPLMLAWARDPTAAWRRIRTWEGALLIAAVAALGVIAVSTDEPVTYMVFPALIWAAFRFGPPGATLSIAIAAGVAIGVTANDVGPFFKQPIDHRTLSTQVYIAVAALTTLFLSAHRQRARAVLRRAGRGEAARGRAGRGGAAPDRARSARLRLPGVVLDGSAHPHRSEGARAGGREPVQARSGGPWAQIGELTRSAQSEMRALIFELGRDPVEDGLGRRPRQACLAARRPGRARHRRARCPTAASRSRRAPRRSSSASAARRSPTS